LSMATCCTLIGELCASIGVLTGNTKCKAGSDKDKFFDLKRGGSAYLGGKNGTCRGVSPHMREVVEVPGGSLFLLTRRALSPARSWSSCRCSMHEAGPFLSCAVWQVYSDVRAELGGDDYTIVVEDTQSDFHILKRKFTGL